MEQAMYSKCGFFLSAVSIGLAMMLAATIAVGYAREFTVQVLSVSDNATAEKMKGALQKDGMDAYIERHEGAAITYRVRIGRFTNLEKAQQFQETLRSKEIESWIARTGAAKPAQASPQPPAETQIPEPAKAEPDRAGARKELPAAEPEADSGPLASAAPLTETDPPEAQGHAAQPAAADKEQEIPAAEPEAVKIFELIINPVPAFNDEPAAVATVTTTTIPPCGPDKQYLYYDPQDAALHITADTQVIPKPFQKRLRQIIIFPASFKRLNLHDLSIQVALEGKSVVLAFDGITQAGQTPPPQAVLDFESVLRENPLRILYYPPRTDPDGTLHGALFFKNGISVEDEMVRLGLAAFQGRQVPP